MPTTSKTLRHFIAFDGEGITDSENTQQRYTLFGNSRGMEISSHDLGAVACFELLLATKDRYPKDYMVVFGGNYDVNMMLRDVPVVVVGTLWNLGYVRWGGYRLRYIPGKMFSVTKNGRTAMLYDVLSFFAGSFVHALTEYGVGTSDEIAKITHGKSQRGSFTDKEMLSLVRPYWLLELELLVKLMDKLRYAFEQADIHLTKWYGPGAVANYVLTKNKIYQHKKELPEEIRHAARSAYAGGRFEQFRIGTTTKTVYQYDIRSAYPHALRNLPSFDDRTIWDQRFFAIDEQHQVEYKPFGLYHVGGYHSEKCVDPQPLHWRSKNNNMAFPAIHGGGWHYGCVLSAIRNQQSQFTVTQCIQPTTDDRKPFRHIEDLYLNRAQHKREGNPAQYAEKLAMNSEYGKLAQQVGHNGKAPKWHQIEWAGMITAHCRAQLYTAMMQKPHAIIACETDSIFSTEPLNLDIGENLGQWDLTVLDGLTYLQSGVYFTQGTGHINSKLRGLGAKSLSWETVQEWLKDPVEPIPVPLTRFMTMGSSLGTDKWCTWRQVTKQVNPLNVDSKRYHDPLRCPECKTGMGLHEGLHTMHINPMAGIYESKEHTVAWEQDYQPPIKEEEDYYD